MIRRVSEGQITWFDDLSPMDLPYPLPAGISIHTRSDQVGLEVHGLVGTIPLANKDTLQIIPKIGEVNFLRILFRSEGLQPDLQIEFDGFVEYAVEDEQNVSSVVARQLLLCAAGIMKRSPKRGRVKKYREGFFAQGQIDAVATALNLAQRKLEPVASIVLERTLDIPENRIISEAALRARTFLRSTDAQSFGWISDRWLDRFPRSKDLWADLDVIDEGFASGRYGGPRDYYREALMLAKVVLGNSGLSLDGSAHITGDAVLLNAADVFERYLRNIISEAYSNDGYIVTKGGSGVASLYTDGSYELKPDIVIIKAGKTLLIADAKYKVPTSADHYQMNVYLKTYGIKRGLLLSPNYSGDNIVLREYATADKIIVKEAFLPMGNLQLTEEFLGTVVERFVV